MTAPLEAQGVRMRMHVDGGKVTDRCYEDSAVDCSISEYVEMFPRSALERAMAEQFARDNAVCLKRITEAVEVERARNTGAVREELNDLAHWLSDQKIVVEALNAEDKAYHVGLQTAIDEAHLRARGGISAPDGEGAGAFRQLMRRTEQDHL